MNQQIMRAFPGDAGTLSKIAFAAKGYWKYPKSWMVEWQDIFRITPQFIQEHAVYKALITGDSESPDIVGFYALMEMNNTIVLEHLWIKPQFIGKGVGRVLFEHAVQVARHNGVKQIVFEADPNAEGFYLHMGAQRIGERNALIDDQPRIVPYMMFIV